MRNETDGTSSPGGDIPRSGLLHAALAFSLVAAQVAPLPLPGFSAIGVAPAAAQRTQVVQCYPRDNQTTWCQLPNGTRSVNFLGPDRSARCQPGRTYGQRGDQLWISDGCGGNFEAAVYGGGWGGGSGGGAGEISCRSNNNRTERCSVNTGNRVQLVQQYSNSPCIEGQSWTYDRNSITVRNGCQARFAVAGSGFGGGNSGGNSGGWGGGSSSGHGFANVLECRSQNNRYQRCSVNTQNRVELTRQLSSTRCMMNRNWGYDRTTIWVDDGCSAQFGYGYGNSGGNWNNGSGGSGSNTGEVIGGVALAAGLIALLAAAGRSGNSSKAGSSSQVAAIDADMQKFPAAARTDANACMREAARQVGATGGTRIRLIDVDTAQRSGDGWMILARLSTTYDNQIQALSMDCRSTNGKVTAFEVR